MASKPSPTDPPVEFLPIAEETGIIDKLAEFTFSAACRRFRSWTAAGFVPPEVCLSVNLSHREARLPDIVESIARTLKAIGLAPDRVRFEIPEQVLMSPGTARLNVAAGLARLGAGIVVVKIGSDPSSLALFQDLPIVGLKIDRTLHAKVRETDPDGEITRSIMGIAGKSNVRATIVGLETEVQLDNARALGFQCGQKSLLSPPLPADAVVALLSSSPR